MVLKSGAKRPVSHISSTLRWRFALQAPAGLECGSGSRRCRSSAAPPGGTTAGPWPRDRALEPKRLQIQLARRTHRRPAPGCLHRCSRPGTRAASVTWLRSSPSMNRFMQRPPHSSCRNLGDQRVFTQPRPEAGACSASSSKAGGTLIELSGLRGRPNGSDSAVGRRKSASSSCEPSGRWRLKECARRLSGRSRPWSGPHPIGRVRRVRGGLIRQISAASTRS